MDIDPVPENHQKIVSQNLYEGRFDFGSIFGFAECGLARCLPYLSRSLLLWAHLPIVTANQVGVKCLLPCIVRCVSTAEKTLYLPYYISQGSFVRHTTASSIFDHGSVVHWSVFMVGQRRRARNRVKLPVSACPYYYAIATRYLA